MTITAQVCLVLLLTASVAPNVFAQIAAEKDAHTSPVGILLATKTDSTRAGGPLNPAPDVNPSASEELKPTAVESAQKSLRAGIASVDAGRYKDAIASFEAARQLVPNSSVVYTWLGHSYFALEEYENSSKAYERAVSLGPISLATRRALGIAYLRLKKPEQAIPT